MITLIILFDINHLFGQSEILKSFISDSNYSMEHYSLICTQLNGSKQSYEIRINQFRHPIKEFQVFLLNTNNSFQHYSFVWTLLNDTNDSYFEHFFLTLRSESIKCLTQGAILIKGYSTFSKDPGLEPYHQIILCYITRTHVMKRSYPSAKILSVYNTAPNEWGVKL